jgi:7-carboxy-7-deazaguanine synthase
MNPKKIPLVEMFGPTIQGEGAVIGQQTYFLRFGLCDYKCKMCDSMHAVDPKQVAANAEWLVQAEIFDKLEAARLPNSTNWVTFSGGNPCIHDLSELVDKLKQADWKIAVETQGTKCPDWLKNCDVITVSPKGPGMGENCNLEELHHFVEGLGPTALAKANFKVVIFDERDLEFTRLLTEIFHGDFYLSLGNPYPPGKEFNSVILNQITHGSTNPEIHQIHMSRLLEAYKSLFEDIKCDPILSKMKFLPQWHTFVWGNAKGK